MKMKSILCSLVLITLMYCFMACKQEKPNTVKQATGIPWKDAIGADVRRVFEEQELLGMSMALIQGGKLAWEGHFGLANVRTERRISGATRYRIASISKMITAMAVLQLLEKGLLDLDVDVTTYLGWQLRNPNHPDIPISLRQLMSHTSGIRDGKGYFDFSKNMLPKQLHIEQLFSPTGKYFTEDMFATDEPGAYFSYANCSWGLIASVLEKVTDTTFDRYCEANIFRPMGLEATFNAAHVANKDDFAALYTFEQQEWKPQADDYADAQIENRYFEGYTPGQNGLLFGPQGSLRATMGDLIAFVDLFLNEGRYRDTQILRPGSIKAMQRPQWTYNEQNGDTWDGFFYAYGLGMHCTLNTPKGDIIFPDRKMVGHPGIAYGLLSDLYLDPYTKTGIIFVTNGSKKAYTYGAKTSFYEVEEALFEKVYPYLKELESQKTSL